MDDYTSERRGWALCYHYGAGDSSWYSMDGSGDIESAMLWDTKEQALAQEQHADPVYLVRTVTVRQVEPPQE